LFALSLLVAVVLAFLALWIRFGLRAWQAGAPRWLTLLSATVMGGAVSGMHYTAMAAAYFLRDGAAQPLDTGLNPTLLAMAVSIVTTLLIGLVLAAGIAHRQLQIAGQLGVSEQKLRRILETMQEGFWLVDGQGRSLDVNMALCNLLARPREDLIGHALSEFVSSDSLPVLEEQQRLRAQGASGQFELVLVRPDGGAAACVFKATPLFDIDGRHVGSFAMITDVTGQKEAQRQIHNLAFYDSLTQLPNRRLLLDRIQQAMAGSHRTGQYGAVLFLDLDHFKNVNDTLGHDVGDLLLSEIAQRLPGLVREDDTVARLGGDEFVLMLEGLSPSPDMAAAQAEAVAEKVRAAIARPVELRGREFHSTASIGVSLFLGHEVGIEELLKHADVAMYQAKDAGRNGIRFFDPLMQAKMDARIALEADLRKALAREELVLHFQPLVDGTRRVIGAEALLRWQHPRLGLLPPGHFIALAEETGLILPIGHWVLVTACARIQAWQADPACAGLTLAVNVSASQFRQPDFVDQVAGVLRAHAVDARLLKLELTESLVLDNVADTIAKMQALKQLGVGFAMDDFGTGYSSLAYLRQLPLDQLKIDRSFVCDVDADADDATIVQTIIAMARNLGLEAIAEGVETDAQWAFLRRHGCDAYQGFLFSRPCPLAEFEQYLRMPDAALGG
jgi:diguanylate cyclase (GGDEF)-like protein/PAS domain S-box-containing protein